MGITYDVSVRLAAAAVDGIALAAAFGDGKRNGYKIRRSRPREERLPSLSADDFLRRYILRQRTQPLDNKRSIFNEIRSTIISR